LSFSVGYPPCVQGVELLPNVDTPSAFDETLPCYEPGDPDHPSFGDPTEYFVKSPGATGQPGREYLEYRGPAMLAVDKVSGATSVPDDTTGMSESHYLIQSSLFRMDLLLHGQDHADERWSNLVMRTGAWKYQIDHACDPNNWIHEGPGSDDINLPLWGTDSPISDDFTITLDGVWRLGIDVPAPLLLLVAGPDFFRTYLTAEFAGGDPELADWIFEASTRQFGAGEVQAIALDQTRCGFWPIRPASYHFFYRTRPPLAAPPTPRTWRSCDLENHVEGIMGSIPLDWAAMASNDDEPVTRSFRLILQDNIGGLLECE